MYTVRLKKQKYLIKFKIFFHKFRIDLGIVFSFYKWIKNKSKVMINKKIVKSKQAVFNYMLNMCEVLFKKNFKKKWGAFFIYLIKLLTKCMLVKID